MAVKKKFVPKKSSIRIYDAGGDLSKRWFIEWRDNHLKPVRSYKGINSHITAAGRASAIDRLINEVTEIDLDSDYPTLIRHIREYIRQKEKHLREKSHQTYLSRLNIFADWYDGRYMDHKSAESFLDFISAELGNSKTTRNDYRTWLKSVWKWMVKREYYSSNPWDDTEKVKTTTQPARAFSVAQIAHLRTIMTRHQPDLWLFCKFIYYTLIRPGEIRHMVVGDLLFDENKILVRSEVSKNGKEEMVVMPRAFVKDLESTYLGADPTLYLFTADGCPGENIIGKNTMSTRHRTLLKSLGYSSQHKLYSWKHTGAKQAVKAGVGLKELQLQLRHHSLDQVDQYLRSLGVDDMKNLSEKYPGI